MADGDATQLTCPRDSLMTGIGAGNEVDGREITPRPARTA